MRLRGLARFIHEIAKQLLDENLRLLIGEIPLRVESIRGVADHDLRLVYRFHVQEYESLAQVILRAS